jgi:hypothetical protein
MRFSVAWKPLRQSGCGVASLAALLIVVVRHALGPRVAIPESVTGKKYSGNYMDQDFRMASDTFID